MSSVSLSLPSMPAPLLSILRKLLPSLPPTGRDMDVPPLYREAFVLSGYRPLGLPWRCYVLSLFQMHKDTVTVWCPLLAAVAMMVRFLFFTVLQGGCPLIYMVLFYSAVSLLLYPYTSCVRSCLLLLDSVGRGVHQAGRALALSLYSSDASWTESAVGQLYFPTAAVLAWLSCTTGCCVELYPHRPNLLHRKLLWGGPVLLAFLLDISPVARRLYTCSWNNQAVLLHSLQVVLFLLAALFFSCPVPECLSPGGFDILGHSRQLLQVLLTLSIVCQQEALLQDFSWRRAGLVRRVGEESLLWSCAVFSVVTLSCSVTALALRRCRVPR
ncbi:hypothetical protein NL108_008335 [Boleophthalmus pectinirostris]|nr:hypothetical protein NL108_008335 [Boleophthalmus pectinirostris]